MDIRETCCSKDKYELTFPSFSAVFIHTFMMDGDVAVENVEKERRKYLLGKLHDMLEELKDEPTGDIRPISSLVEYKPEPDVHFVKMEPDVEKLLFPAATLDRKQIARYSIKGFDFRIPVRSAKEKNKEGKFIEDFPPIDFEGHANVEVSQFFGNIFSVTYRFLFDGFTCNIYKGCDDEKAAAESVRESVDAATNHVIGLLSTCLSAEYWSDNDDDEEETNGIDLKNKMRVYNIWVDSEGNPIERDEKGKNLNPVPKDPDEALPKGEVDEEDDNGVWRIEGSGRVFDKILLRYKKFLMRRFLGGRVSEMTLKEVSVADDSRYAMVDIWENLKHPFVGDDMTDKDLFIDECVMEPDGKKRKLTEAEIIDHVRDHHKPELVGLMSLYPAEWPYRDSKAFDDVCGCNIAIDTDDLVLAGSHMTIVIGTYARRGEGTNSVNWKDVMRGRRFYHVSWEEYLLVVQFVLAKKFTFNNTIDRLLQLTEDMSLIDKMKISECAKSVLATSKKAIELDVIRHMKFPSHKVMYDRTAERLELESDFQRFKDVQEVVSANLQSLADYHSAKADSWINTGVIAISVVSLFELAFQEDAWPFIEYLSCNTADWSGVASVVSMFAAILGVIGLGWVGWRIYKQLKES